MTGYYTEHLSGLRLQECYELAPTRVRRYLESEIRHVLRRLSPGDTVLELGCGYGRVASRLAEKAGRVVGVDVAEDSLSLAIRFVGESDRFDWVGMDASKMGFENDVFDTVVCVQNGVCAFGAPVVDLMREALRVVKPGGRVLMSTYADAFWEERLAWFELQADAGLVGPIDRAATRRGVIVCTDGFEAGTMSSDELMGLCAAVKVTGTITEVDESSLFCEAVK